MRRLLAALLAAASPLVPLACCVVAGLYVARKVLVYARLRQFRGPFWAALSDWPHSWAMLHDDCHEWYAAINEKYGPIARIAPNILITSCPAVWGAVNREPGYKRSDWYYQACRLEHRRDNIFSQTDNIKHDARRKQMLAGYSGREILHLEASIDQHVQEFLHLLRRKCLSSNGRVVPVDLAQKVQFFTLDVISIIGLGSAFGMLRTDSDVDDYARLSKKGLDAARVTLAMGFSWLAHVPVIGRWIAPSPRDRHGFGKAMAACFRRVDERAAKPTDGRSDMLASFIRHGLGGDDLRSEALEQVVAGSDTTSSAICGTLLHLMTNPRVYAKLQREVDDAVGDGKAPRPVITTAQAKKLPYLGAVIREALRMWPPAVNLFPRDVPAKGATVCVGGDETVFLPGGVCIGYSAHAMHRSQDVYGGDAHVFRPERWLERDHDQYADMCQANRLVFGHSRFHCLGEPIAKMEIEKMVFETLRNFDLALAKPTRPWKARNLLGLFAISDMWVHAVERAVPP